MKNSIAFLFSGVILISLSCSKNPKNDVAPHHDSVSVKEDSSKASTSAAVLVFNKDLKYNQYHFKISAKDNEVTIEPSGLEIDNAPITKKFVGTIKDAEIGDINADNQPEVFIYTYDGANEKGSVIGYSSNNGKSINEVYFPELDEKYKKGYNGGDEFAMVENTFVQRFPIFENGSKTAKTRQIQYKLKEGEAMRKLVVDKMIEY